MHPALELAASTLVLAILGLAGCKRDGVDPERKAAAEQAYRSLCARCHGEDGRGGAPVAGVAPRNFRDAAFQRTRSDDELAHVIKEGKGVMPAFKAVYDDRQIADLVQLIRGFK